VSLHDWLLFLHVFAAFALVAAEVLYTFLIVWLWRTDLPSDIARVSGISKLGMVLIIVGSLGTILLGVILAFEADSYAIWDGWIIAAIVLWALLMEVGRRAGASYDETGKRARTLVAEGRDQPNVELGHMFRSAKALWLHSAAAALVVLILLDMILKPGA
jgi:hypothetical protein